MTLEITHKDSEEAQESFFRKCIAHMLLNRPSEPVMKKAIYDTATRQLSIFNEDGTVDRISINQI